MRSPYALSEDRGAAPTTGPAVIRMLLATTVLEEATRTSGALLALLFAAVGELAAIVFVAGVLRKGGSPSATLTWIVLILVAPWAGLLLYYLLPRSIQMRRLARRKRTLAWVENSLDALPDPAPVEVASTDPLVRLLAHDDPDALSGGNAVQLLETGTEFFSLATEAIVGARRFVHMEAYIFRSDATGRMLLRVLAEAARRGVEVRLLYDAVGSWSLRKRDLAELRASGGRAEPAIPMLWRRRPFTFNLRNHRKLLVVDGVVGFLGGRNVGDEYAKDRFGAKRTWLDTMLRIAGPAVARLQRVFVEDWCNATGEDVARREYFPEVGSAGKESVAIVCGGPDTAVSVLYQTMFQLVVASERVVEVSSPYLIPDTTLLTALQVAARRGVAVRIHTNGPSAAHFLLYHAARSYYRALLEAGAEIVETTGDYNHSKLVVVDGRTCFVGSPNLDARSFDLNFEIGAVVLGGEIPRAASRMFRERSAKGRSVNLSEVSRKLGPTLLDGACRLASPLL